MKVRFHSLAERELIAAALYLDQEAGLGSEFLDEYADWEGLVQAHPESCPEIGVGIRKGLLKRFKYLIGYKIQRRGPLSAYPNTLYPSLFSKPRRLGFKEVSESLH